jgi:diphthamide synthase (EF-2-diphthine--ammonia ligase)
VTSAWMSWSSGKDSALALHETRIAGDLDVIGLLTTVNGSFDRVAMHGVRRSLLEAQAAALGLPLHIVELPSPCPNEVYERRMAVAVDAARRSGIEAMVFGDLFLEDIRRYREAALDGSRLTPVFPLWSRPTPEVARTLVDLEFRAVVVCVDPAQAPCTIAGRCTTPPCSTTCPPVSTRVGRTASSTPWWSTALVSPAPSMSRSARSWSATGSSSPT